MRLLRNIPRVTAGLMWHPEMGPTVNAIAISDNPKASATPTLWTCAPAITAVVRPAKTNTNVPNNSAAYFTAFSSVRDTALRLSRTDTCGHNHPCRDGCVNQKLLIETTVRLINDLSIMKTSNRA